jgi:CheY-like chemotaxis protein
MPTKKKIIIVEDNDFYRSALKKLINSHDDLEVVAEAIDGVEAMGVLGRQPADLVLLDLRLPGTSGYEILRDAGGNPAMKIMVLTGLESERNIREAMDAGADGYCFKDVGSAELLIAIATVLSGGRYVSEGRSGPDEKRREARHTCDCPIQWAYFNQMAFSPGRLVNCSRTGIFFETRQPVLAGATVLIRVERNPPERQPAIPACLRSNVAAEVKWCHPRGKVYRAGARYHYTA